MFQKEENKGYSETTTGEQSQRIRENINQQTESMQSGGNNINDSSKQTNGSQINDYPKSINFSTGIPAQQISNDQSASYQQKYQTEEENMRNQKLSQNSKGLTNTKNDNDQLKQLDPFVHAFLSIKCSKIEESIQASMNRVGLANLENLENQLIYKKNELARLKDDWKYQELCQESSKLINNHRLRCLYLKWTTHGLVSDEFQSIEYQNLLEDHLIKNPSIDQELGNRVYRMLRATRFNKIKQGNHRHLAFLTLRDIKKKKKQMKFFENRSLGQLNQTPNDQARISQQKQKRIDEKNQELEKLQAEVSQQLEDEELTEDTLVKEIKEIREALKSQTLAPRQRRQQEKSLNDLIDILKAIIQINQLKIEVILDKIMQYYNLEDNEQIYQSNIDVLILTLRECIEKFISASVPQAQKDISSQIEQCQQVKTCKEKVNFYQAQIEGREYVVVTQPIIQNKEQPGLIEPQNQKAQNQNEASKSIVVPEPSQGQEEYKRSEVEVILSFIETNSNKEEIKSKYLVQNEAHRLQILDYFIEKDEILYILLLQSDETIKETKAYKELKMEVEFSNISDGDDEKKIQILLQKLFNKGGWSAHSSMKIYQSLEEKSLQKLESPLKLKQLIKDFEQIQAQPEYLEIHNKIMKKIKGGKINKIQNLFESANQANLNYGSQIKILLLRLKIFMRYEEIQKLINSFQDISQQIKSIPSFAQLVKNLKSEKIMNIAQIFRMIINDVQNDDNYQEKQLDQEILNLYISIIKYFPGLKQYLNEEHLISSFAPQQLVSIVNELFSKINSRISFKKQVSNKEQHDLNLLDNEESFKFIQALQQLLEKILHEDEIFAQKLIKILKQIKTEAEVQEAISKIRSLKDLRERDLEQIDRMIIYKASRLQTITDFMQIEIDLDVEALQLEICEEFSQKGIINGNKLQMLLYDFIKRRCSFENVLTKLSKIRQDQPLTEQTLLNFILGNSDTYLKTLILLACSNFMPLPLITFQKNYSDLYQNKSESQQENQLLLNNQNQEKIDQKFSPLIYQELFYSFEKYKSVFNFKLSANQNRSPQGCSTIANMIFNKTFQKHSKTNANYGTVEIQFDYNFEQPMFIPVSDAHGLIEREQLEKIYPLFNIFIIHMSLSKNHSLQKQNDEILESELNKIRTRRQQNIAQIQNNNLAIERSLVIIFLHDESLSEPFFKQIEETIYEKGTCNEQKVVRILISPFDRMLDMQKCQVVDIALLHYKEEIRGFKSYQEEYMKRINALEQFINFIEEFNCSKEVSSNFNIIDSFNELKQPQDEFITLDERMIDYEEEKKQSQLSFKIAPINPDDINDDEFESAQEDFDEDEIYSFIKMKIQYYEQNVKNLKKLKEALTIFKEVLDIISQNKENLHSEQFLTMNYYFKQVCKMEKNLTHDRNLNSEKCEEMRKKIEVLYEQMRKSNPCSLTKSLEQIIAHQNFIGLSTIISKLIKGYLNGQMKNLINSRTQLRAEAQNQSLENYQKDAIIEQIQSLSKQIEAKWYSNEFLYREYYIQEKSFSHQDFDFTQLQKDASFDRYFNLVNLQIKQGQPFEIIDGNNLSFVSEVYEKLSSDEADEKILVVSVIGPQSSGKSLLLNTLFGAQFLSSAGRCTRGLYGCLLDVKGVSRYSKILLLDSEGIQSTEVRDEAFDKRIVFYILCVSHVVLICNKGEMNQPMQEMIKIATDAISQLREQISKQPQVNIIMNMIPQIDEQSLSATIQDLQTTILEMNQQKNIQQLFTIDSNNVFMLPNAFAQSGSEDMIVNRPSYQFAKAVEKLKKKILDYMKNNEPSRVANYNISKWFKFAANFWIFTDQFEGITEYNSLEERKQAQALHEEITNIIKNSFEEKNWQKIEEEIKSIVDQVLQKINRGGFSRVSQIQLQQKVDTELLPYQRQIQNRITTKFNEYCFKSNINPRISEKQRDQLIGQVNQHILSWQPLINKLISEFCDVKFKFVADQTLKIQIEKLLQNNESTFTQQQAEELFNQEWEKIEDNLKHQLQNKEEIFHETCKSVSALYRPNIKAVGHYEVEKQLSYDYQMKGQIVMQKFLKERPDFLFFCRQVRPDPQKYVESLKKPKEYLKAQDYFIQNHAYLYYNWKEVIQQRFKFDLLRENLKIRIKRGNYKQKILKLVSTIEANGQPFGIATKDVFKSEILALNKEYNRKLSQHNNILIHSETEEKYANLIANEFILKVQSNIPIYFEYWQFFKVNNEDNKDNQNYFDEDGIRNNQGYRPSPFAQKNYQQPFYADSHSLQIKEGMELVQKSIDKVQLTVKPDIKNYNKYFYRYLKYLVEPDKEVMNEASLDVEEAQKQFYQKIDFDNILIKIQSIVLEQISKLEVRKDIRPQEMDFTLQSIRQSQQTSIIEDYCTLDFTLIQGIVIKIQGIAAKIDEELEPFCLKVSEKGMQTLHLIAQSYISSLTFEIRWLTTQTPLIQLQNNKNLQRELFIAKLTSNDTKMDTANAKRTAEDLAKHINDTLKLPIIQRFQSMIQAEKDNFQLKNIVFKIEEFLIEIADGKHDSILDRIQTIDKESNKEERKQNRISKDINESAMDKFVGFLSQSQRKLKQFEDDNKQGHQEESKGQNNGISYQQFYSDQQFQIKIEEFIKFYVQPGVFLQTKFEKTWRELTQNELNQSLKQFINKRNEAKKNIEGFFQKLNELAKSNHITVAGNVFVINHYACSTQTKGNDIIITGNYLKVIQQRAMTEYFLRLCDSTWNYDSKIEIDSISLKFDDENVTPIYPQDIRIQLDNNYVEYFKQLLKGDNISNLSTFIEQFNKNFLEYLENNVGLSEVELIGNLYQSMKQKSLGCDQYCPLCRRQCDQDHSELIGNRIHKCDGGHQIQAFAGNREKKSGRALIYGCHEFEEQDEVQWQGKEIKWRDFKEKMKREKQWYLDEIKPGANNLAKERNNKIWNLVGEQICLHYQISENIPIQFVKAKTNKKRNEITQGKILYILLLDMSGSMREKESNEKTRWDNMTIAVSGFLEALTLNTDQLQISKVSLITYNTSAGLNCDQQPPSKKLLKTLPWFARGDTDFNPPFKLAKEQMDKYLNEYETFVLCMMTDGEGEYPTQVISEIKQSPKIMDKLIFKSIAYGKSAEIEKIIIPMAKDLNGTYEKALAPEELSQAFLSVIPNPNSYHIKGQQ